jgi:hypothetical protein
MIIIFNFIGAGIMLAGILVGSLVAHLFGDKSGAPSLVLEGLIITTLDLLYRKKAGGGSLIHPRMGGHVMFIPAWLIGAGLLVTGGFGFFAWNHEPPAGKGSVLIIQSNNPQPSAGPSGGYQAVSSPPRPANAGLRLNMISGSGPQSLALINGENFAAGETHNLAVGKSKISVTCLEIRDKSVVVSVAGEPRPVQLRLGESIPVVVTP